MRSLCIVSAIAAVGLTTPASAEQADPSTRQQIERITDAFAENWNKQDAAGIAGLFTKDGVIVTSNARAVDTGRQEIEQHFQNVFKPAFLG